MITEFLKNEIENMDVEDISFRKTEQLAIHQVKI